VRDFTWHVFTQTGDIEAYLLFKEMDKLGTSDTGSDIVPDADESGRDADGALV
jgi:hypothetical protein